MSAVREGSPDVQVRVGPEAVTDWLLRCLCPALLEQAGYPGFGRVLREDLEPVTSGAGLHNRYVMSRLATTLRAVREELDEALACERMWLPGLPGGSTVARYGGPVRFRSVVFPELDVLTGFVARTVPTGVGVLLEQCVQATIELVTAHADNDGTAAATLRALGDMYDAAWGELAWGHLVTGSPFDPRCQVTPARHSSNGHAGFRGVFTDKSGTIVCPHVHTNVEAARQCVRQIARRVDRGTR